jgi:hypothetical protein
MSALNLDARISPLLSVEKSNTRKHLVIMINLCERSIRLSNCTNRRLRLFNSC